MSYDVVAIIVAGCAMVVLIVLSVFLYFYRKQKKSSSRKSKEVRISAEQQSMVRLKNVNQMIRKQKSIRKNGNLQNSTGQITEHEKKGNMRLDGARVSHRREHPDRIAQEEALKNIRHQEEEKSLRQQEFERKNRLQIVYSPCNGDIVSIAGSLDEAQEIGLTNPGIVMIPGDVKISSPIDGFIRDISNEHAQILLETKRGVYVRLSLNPEEVRSSNWMLRATRGISVKVGDELLRFNDKNNENINSYKLSVIIENYKQEQLLLVRKANYVSAGDKLITIKEEKYT